MVGGKSSAALIAPEAKPAARVMVRSPAVRSLVVRSLASAPGAAPSKLSIASKLGRRRRGSGGTVSSKLEKSGKAGSCGSVS